MSSLKQEKIDLKKRIDGMIDAGTIKNYAELGKRMGYSRGAISELLNENSTKKISERFLLKLDKEFSSPYIDIDPFISNDPNVIVAVNRVLWESLAQIIAEKTGKNITVVKEDLKQAVKIQLKESWVPQKS